MGWTPEQISTFIEYRNKIVSRLHAGESIENFTDKPIGFIEWLKEHPPIEIGYSPRKQTEYKICWNCNNEYPIDYRKCPKCKSFNPDANKNK